MKLIHQLAKETGIAIATIRFYEKTGLFTGKKKKENTSNNYTYYDEEVIGKLNFIRAAKSIGFSLTEIKAVIDAWYNKRTSKTKKMEILDNRLAQINTKIKELNSVKKQIMLIKANIEENDC